MKSLFVTALVIIVFNACSTGNKTHLRTGEYFGEKEPADTARIFAEGVISTSYNVRDFALSNDRKEIFYTLRGPSGGTIIFVKKNGSWSEPEVASFSGEYFDTEPCFSPEGNRLYFASNRPLEKGEEAKDFDIWYTERDGELWGDPVNLGAPVNSEKNEFYPTFTSDGTLYLTASYETSLGGEDIFYSEFVDGKFQEPQNLGVNINTAEGEYNAFIAPDGSYLIYNSEGYEKGVGGGDLLISFKDDNNNFQKPVNMGERVNSPSFEFCPYVTPDGKYFFFTSNRRKDKASKERSNYSDLMAELQSSQNGSLNIYWIRADFIQKLKSEL